MLKLLVWCLLFVICWPVALIALAAYPIVWVIGLPFRLLGRTVSATLDLVLALVLFPIRLPARMLRL
jgi:hypothetical protein